MNTDITEEPTTPVTPKSPLWTLKRTISIDPSCRSSGSWYSGTMTLMTTSNHEEDPPATYEVNLFNFGFIIKLLQWLLCILCTGLHSEGSALMSDFSTRIIAYVTSWSYMMITGVIILSYLLGQKMREVLIRTFNILGAIMFFATGVIVSNVVYTTQILMTEKVASYYKTQVTMLICEAVACFINCLLYVTDTAVSLRRSYYSVSRE